MVFVRINITQLCVDNNHVAQKSGRVFYNGLMIYTLKKRVTLRNYEEKYSRTYRKTKIPLLEMHERS